MPESKTFTGQFEIKNAAKGQVSAVFSTFDVIDKDGDVTPSSAIKHGADIVVSAYGHKSWQGELPVGTGTIRTTKTEAIADMQFLMNTTHGADAFNTVQALAKKGLGEWSYGFNILDAEPAIFDGKEVRMLKAMDVFEVSPVLQGAGVDTRTLSAKGAKDNNVPGYGGAIKSHETAISKGAWNEAAVIAGIRNDASIVDLRDVFAWVNPETDPELKSSYKFAHHESAGGAANLRACVIGIAVLNGACGDSGIKAEQRQAVYNHLAGHLDDAEYEVPELRDLAKGGSLKFTDDIAGTLARVSSLTQRAEEVMALRVRKGRASRMAPASLEMLSWVYEEMRDLKTVIDTPEEDLRREVIRYIANSHRSNTA